MCGIAGFISHDTSFAEPDLSVFCASLAHRGPNGKGTFYENRAGFAHTRLSIQDVSKASNQPFLSANGRYVAIFNGEIYNFKELAKEFDFLKTSSDTEVLVEMFARYGIACLSQLRGMFAFAIYDRAERKTWIARDRLGIKPLYVFRSKNTFAFASELKALTSHSFIRNQLSLDEEAQNHFLHLGFVSEPHSIYKEIKKFASGHWGCVASDTLDFEAHSYWQLDYTQDLSISYKEAKEQTNQFLVDSVKEHLISDVPIGLFLSGGTDSSLLAAIAQKHSSQPLKTFSIGFKNSVHNEAPYAKKIAEHLKTDHTEYTLVEEEALEIMEDILVTYDEPFADSSAIPTLLISKLASQKVKVALSGEGGDELFYGYGTYLWAERLSYPFVQSNKKSLQLISQFIPGSKGQKAYNMLQNIPNEFLPAHVFSQEHGFFSAKEIYGRPFQKLCYYGQLLNAPFRDLVTHQNRFDFQVALKDNLLTKIDRAGMRYGLETRVPFLDHRLVEWVVKLDKSYKSKGLQQKILLKDILCDYLPVHYFNRPKWGFGIELGELLNKKGIFCDQDMPSNKKYALYLLKRFIDKSA